jgi:hypothetical protein
MPTAAVGRTSVLFQGPENESIGVTWFGPAGVIEPGLATPARYNFPQGGIYRLKLSGLPGYAGIDLYPTLEVLPATYKSVAYLSHASVPVTFTREDIEQVMAGNFLVKVIYLPDPQFQDLALAGPNEIVSSRLDPGVDPVVEAQRRGTILLIVRMGNINLELKNSPAMDAPPGTMHGPAVPPGAPVVPPVGPAPMPARPMGNPIAPRPISATPTGAPKILPPSLPSGGR